MSTEVQQLRGTTAENDTFTGKSGVLTIDTGKKDIRVHDGVKQGGYSILDRATQLQKAGGVINGDVTINSASGTNYAILPDAAGGGNPAIRLGYTKEDKNFTDLAFVDSSFNIYLNKFGVVAKFNVDGTTSFSKGINIQGKTSWQPNGDITGSIWEGNSLKQHINTRFNACVTDTRFYGYGEVGFSTIDGAFNNPVPSGYVLTGLWKENQYWEVISYRQPQVYIANRGWFALGGW